VSDHVKFSSLLSSNSVGFDLSGSLGSLLLLSVLGEELLVLGNSLLGGFPSVLAALSNDLLSAHALLRDNTLDFGGLVESLVTSLDLTLDNVLLDIVLLLEGEHLNDVVLSLGGTHVGLVNVGAAVDLRLSLLDNLEVDGANIGSDDASSDSASSALTDSSGLVESTLLSEEDSGSAVDKDTLLHGETLLVVATVDSENVALKVISQNVAVDFLTHTSVEEGADVFFIINFNFLLTTGGGVRNVKLRARCR